MSEELKQSIEGQSEGANVTPVVKVRRQRKPTIKQKKALTLLVGNGGNVTRAMIDAGYSPNTANTPQKLTESKSWAQLMEKYLPDSKLAEVHEQQLEATKMQVVDKIPEYNPDNDARLKALDLAYKLKGRYAPEQIEMTKRKYQDLSNAELAELQKKLKDFLLKRG